MRSFAPLLLTALLATPSLAIDITGWVLDEDGAPIVGARVTTHREERHEERRARWLAGGALPVLAETATDAKGRFRVEAEYPVALRVEAPGREPYAPLLAPDGEVGAIVLRKAPPVRGVVAGPDGPLAGARVVLRAYLGFDRIVTTGLDGSFEAPSPQVWAVAAAVIHPAIGVAEVPLPRAPEPLRISLPPPKIIEGSVAGPDGAPVPGATVMLDEWALAVTDDEGRFIIRHSNGFTREVRAEAGSLFARAPSADSPVRLVLQRTHTLEGTVRDPVTREPVPFAYVIALDESRRELRGGARADGRGRYRIEKLAPARYSVAATPGQTPMAPAKEGIPVSIPATGPLDVTTTTAQALVRGFVLDSKGRPIAGAGVVPITGELSTPEYFRHAVRTAPDGSFLIRGFAWKDDRQKAYLFAEWKGIVARSEALPETLDGPVTLVIPPAAPLAVSVRDAAGNPIEGAAVTAVRVWEGAPSRGDRVRVLPDSPRTGADGAIELHLAPGVYDLAIDAEGFIAQRVVGRRAERGSRADVVLERGAPLRGRVVRTDGSPIAGAPVRVYSNEVSADATTDADGRFSIAELPPGNAQLHVILRELGGMSAPQTVTIPNEKVVVEVPASATISGRVSDRATGAPITRFQLGTRITAPDGSSSMPGRWIDSSDGTFSRSDVRPGNVSIIVSADGYVPYTGAMRRIAEGETLEALEIRLERGSTVRGRVTGPEGAPVEGAVVTIEQDRFREVPFARHRLRAVTDPQGEYAIPTVEQGTNTLRVSKERFLAEMKTIDVSAGDVRADVQLATGDALRGTIVDAGGLPVAGARITARAPVPGHFSAESDASGNFVVEALPRGLYDLEVRKEGYATATPRRVAPWETAHLRIALAKESVVHGRVSGLPASGARANVAAQFGAATEHVNVDADGTYRIQGLAGGTGSVWVSATVGGRTTNSARRTVTVPPGDELRVDFDLGGDPIRGRVTRNGAPAEGAQVTLTAAGNDGRGIRRDGGSATSIVDASGMYEVRGLEPGSYLMQVRMGRNGAAFDRECRIETTGCDADLVGSPVEIAILDASTRKAIVDSAVQLTQKSLRLPSTSRFESDAEGVVSFEFVPAGVYEIVATAPGYSAVRQEVQTGAGAARRIEVPMRAEASTVLRLVDASTGRQVMGSVEIESIDAPPLVQSRFLAADGTVSLALPRGVYRGVAKASGFAPRTIELRLPQAEPVDVPLVTGGDIVVVNASRLEGRIRIARADLASRLVAASMPADCILRANAADAGFHFLEPGRYRLDLIGTDGKTLRTANVELRDNKLLKVTW